MTGMRPPRSPYRPAHGSNFGTHRCMHCPELIERRADGMWADRHGITVCMQAVPAQWGQVTTAVMHTPMPDAGRTVTA